MNACLVIMAPRHVHECEAATRELAIPKLWLRGYTEAQLADGVFAAALDAHPFDHYIVASDDIIIRPHALEAVLEQLTYPNGVVTGYSQRTHTDWTVNLTYAPLDGDHPSPDAYQFMSFQDVVSQRAPVFRTWFTGMSLTAMSREMWQQFPFDCYRDKPEDRGYASDFSLSLRLQRAHVPVLACREAFAYHWRYKWQSTADPRDDALLTGQIQPRVEFEP